MIDGIIYSSVCLSVGYGRRVAAGQSATPAISSRFDVIYVQGIDRKCHSQRSECFLPFSFFFFLFSFFCRRRHVPSRRVSIAAVQDDAAPLFKDAWILGVHRFHDCLCRMSAALCCTSSAVMFWCATYVAAGGFVHSNRPWPSLRPGSSFGASFRLLFNFNELEATVFTDNR